MSADDAIAEAKTRPELIAQARIALPALHKVVEAGGEEAVRQVIGRRLETFPQPQRSDAAWVAWWADYYDALSEQPAIALEAGMRLWVAQDTSGFMPKPGQLLALVKQAAEPHWRALSRANRIAKAEPDAHRQYGTLEERQAQAAEIRAALNIKPMNSETQSEGTPQ